MVVAGKKATVRNVLAIQSHAQLKETFLRQLALHTTNRQTGKELYLSFCCWTFDSLVRVIILIIDWRPARLPFDRSWESERELVLLDHIDRTKSSAVRFSTPPRPVATKMIRRAIDERKSLASAAFNDADAAPPLTPTTNDEIEWTTNDGCLSLFGKTQWMNKQITFNSSQCVWYWLLRFQTQSCFRQ